AARLPGRGVGRRERAGACSGRRRAESCSGADRPRRKGFGVAGGGRAGARAQVVVAQNRVQVLTVHAAKGLEWQVVAVPHLSGGLFPSTAQSRTWLTDAADLPPLQRGDRSSEGVHGVPVLDTSDVTDRKQLSDKISAHRAQLEQRRIDEERRLLYVAITRSEDTLLLSGHHWAATGIKPRGPSDFLSELKDVIDQSPDAGQPCGVVERWAPAPADGER